MSAVWEHAPYDAGALLVLLALSDYSNDDGECWPNVSSIAGKTRLGVRQVHNILRQLKSDGAISIKPGGGRGVSNRYQIHTETLKSISVKSDSVKPISVKSATETVQSIAQNGAICDIAIRKNRQEPSIEPSAANTELAYVSALISGDDAQALDLARQLAGLDSTTCKPVPAPERKHRPKSKAGAHAPMAPTVQEVIDYCKERNNAVNAQQWHDYYCSNGWKVGRNAMKDWKAAVRTWERNGNGNATHPAVTGNVMDRFKAGA